MAETTTFQAAAYTAQGAERESVTLPRALFDGTVNMPVMHQAVKAYLANQRQGNASTKIRKYVSGGNQKPWKQKGTGRARQGSIRAPQWVGGGTVFGPVPRSYAQYVPRQVRQLARKSAFNARARENAIFVVDGFAFESPKTKQLVDLITRLGVADRKVLILTEGAKENVFLSGRNLPLVHVMPYGDVSTYHILWSDVVLIESGALGSQLEPAEGEEETPRPKKAASARKAASKAGAKKAATRGAAKKAAKRPAAKKSAAKKSASKSTKKKGK
ncbi:MAG TPA: 50S ribosomal protein L4 [Gemmatimonadaceae bacterium]|jgi:large subunit ribosomal protein L4